MPPPLSSLTRQTPRRLGIYTEKRLCKQVIPGLQGFSGTKLSPGERVGLRKPHSQELAEGLNERAQPRVFTGLFSSISEQS